MTGRSVENRLRKKKRAGGLRARFYDVVIEAFRVDDAAVRDGEDQRSSLRGFGAERHVGVGERFDSGDGGEARDRAGTTQTRMSWRLGQRGRGNAEDRIITAERIRKWFGDRHLALQQTLPNFIHPGAERRDPTHPG